MKRFLLGVLAGLVMARLWWELGGLIEQGYLGELDH